MRVILRLGIAWALFASAGYAVDWRDFHRQGHVNDFAGVVDAPSRRQLEDYCRRTQETSGIRIDLVTLPSLRGEPVEDVTRTLATAWGNDGVVLLLSIGDHRTRFLVGPAAKPLLPTGFGAKILWNMRPALRGERYGEAFRAAAESTASALAGARHIAAQAPITAEAERSWVSRVPWLLIGFAGAVFGALAASVRKLWREGWGMNRRGSWGSESSSGFGGFDSADSFGGFGGDSNCSDASASGDW